MVIDSGEYGEPGDSGESGDSGDSGESGKSGDSGECGDLSKFCCQLQILVGGVSGRLARGNCRL